MIVGNVVHKGLRRFVESNDTSGLPPKSIERIRDIVSFLEAMDDVSEVMSVPAWKAHQLKGSRKGVWSLVVTRNWRITFSINRSRGEIVDLNFEDYH
jgi:proteic killer suppression protein